MFVNMLVL